LLSGLGWCQSGASFWSDERSPENRARCVACELHQDFGRLHRRHPNRRNLVGKRAALAVKAPSTRFEGESSMTKGPPSPTVAFMPPPGECRATVIRLTNRHSRSGTDRVSANAVRYAYDGLRSIYDLQAHGATTVPLPGSPRCACRGLAPQRAGSVEPVSPSNIALMSDKPHPERLQCSDRSPSTMHRGYTL
jgi:hypothetical protein